MRQWLIFEKELKHFENLHPDFIKVVEACAEDLVNAHTRFAIYLGAKRFEAVTLVLPPDILGFYVLIANPKNKLENDVYDLHFFTHTKF